MSFKIDKQTLDDLAIFGNDRNMLEMDGVFHPFLERPVGNTIHVDENSNVIFLTGANMAGKSTFMKSFGIAIFLAHVGFPVPAKKMEFSVQNGMFTTINLPDNLSMGYSHFYAEVLRVKKVARQVQHARNLIVVFDELFRGPLGEEGVSFHDLDSYYRGGARARETV